MKYNSIEYQEGKVITERWDSSYIPIIDYSISILNSRKREIENKRREKQMTEQITNWLEEEAKELNEQSPKQFEDLPSLKLTPNMVTEIDIDISKPFDKWTGEQGNKTITKKIIPVNVNGVRMVWWLNIKNPIYRDVVDCCNKGITHLKILQTGTQASTKYVLVK